MTFRNELVLGGSSDCCYLCVSLRHRCRSARLPNLHLGGRSILLRQYEIIHRCREPLLLIRSGYTGGSPLHFGTSISHGNAHATLLEHSDVVGHVSDRGDLLWRDPKEL